MYFIIESLVFPHLVERVRRMKLIGGLDILIIHRLCCVWVCYTRVAMAGASILLGLGGGRDRAVRWFSRTWMEE